jgi:hypothetical protein
MDSSNDRTLPVRSDVDPLHPLDPDQSHLPKEGVEGPHIFAPGFAREMRTLAYIRAEMGMTIILDGSLLLLAVAVRAILLAALHWFAAPDAMDWSLRIVEWVLNFGLVGTVIIFTGFDLLKRIRNGYRAWRKSDD